MGVREYQYTWKMCLFPLQYVLTHKNPSHLVNDTPAPIRLMVTFLLIEHMGHMSVFPNVQHHVTHVLAEHMIVISL